MQFTRTALGLFLGGWLTLGHAQDLPLPQRGGVSDARSTDPIPPVFLKPTTSIKPPVPATSASAPALRREAEERVTAALKRIVVMQSAAGRKLDKTAPPPSAVDGKAVTLIGIDAPKDAVNGLESFFGVQLTPDNEKKLLETVRKGMAGASSQTRTVEVLGWWPKEGVMAVGVSPAG